MSSCQPILPIFFFTAYAAKADAESSIQIFFKNLSSKTIALDVKKSDTVLAVKEKIRDKEGIDPSQQRLIFARSDMLDEDTLRDYGIENNSTISLVVRGRGGKKKKRGKKRKATSDNVLDILSCGRCGSRTIMVLVADSGRELVYVIDNEEHRFDPDRLDLRMGNDHETRFALSVAIRAYAERYMTWLGEGAPDDVVEYESENNVREVQTWLLLRIWM